METFTAEEAIRDLSKLIRLAHEENTQIRITSNEGTAILLSEEGYHNLIVTLEVLSTPGLMNRIKTLQNSSESFDHLGD